MKKFADLFPSLVSEIISSLRNQKITSLECQLSTAEIKKVTYDEEVRASYVYLRIPSSSNPVNSTGDSEFISHGQTMEVDTKYWTLLDVNESGFLTGIEILSPADLEPTLRRLAHG